MEVGVLFSEDGFLALNKPPGMGSQGAGTPGLPELWEMVRLNHPEGNIAHRIDRFTSGINLAGASRQQVRYLMNNWHCITRKTYLAVIASPVWDEKIVDKPLKGKTAVTSFKGLERSGTLALVQCQLVKNGRTHQIRRHLKSVGSPIVGDRKYKGSKTKAREGQLLHAWRMEIRLPDADGKPREWVTIQAPIHPDFKTYQFDWERWDAQASPTIGVWEIPCGWRKEKRILHAA